MTHSSDDILEDCNITELLYLAEAQGLGLLSSARSRRRLQSIVRGEVEPKPDDMCPSIPRRQQLSAFVGLHKDVLYNQVPTCKGACPDFGCPIGIALNCHDENREHFD